MDGADGFLNFLKLNAWQKVKELLNMLAIRLREALQAREDAWDKQLEGDIEAGKLEHLQEDARRAKKTGKRIDYPRANTKTS